jgi:hypothetical protein
LDPAFPENRLNLAEACLKWHDKKALQRELDALGQLWQAAHTNFVGPDWELSWADWSQREKKLRENATALLRH